MDTHQQRPTWKKSQASTVKLLSWILQVTKVISRAPWNTINPEPVYPVASTFRICACSIQRALPLFGDLVYCALQSFLMLVSLLEGTTSAENRFGEARLQNPPPQSALKAYLQILCHCSATNSDISLLLAVRSREPVSIGIQGVTLLYLLRGHGVSHLKIGYYSSLDEPQVELTAGVHQSDFC